MDRWLWLECCCIVFVSLPIYGGHAVICLIMCLSNLGPIPLFQRSRTSGIAQKWVKMGDFLTNARAGHLGVVSKVGIHLLHVLGVADESLVSKW